MKKIKKIFTSLTLAMSMMIAVPLSSCNQEGTTHKGAAFTTYLGDTFVLPFAGKVLDSDGNEVSLSNGSFRVTDKEGYVLKSNGVEYKIEVSAQKPISITSEFSEKYIIFESGKAYFPTTTVNGAIGKVTTEYRVFKGEDSYYHNDGAFIPNETGDYTLQITCTDSMGNSATSSVLYHVVEETDPNADAIAVFDAPSGVEHFEKLYGLTSPEFTEEMAYGGERGSTKMTISGENHFMQSFQLVNLYDADISDDLGFYFNIYNAGSQAIKLYINWAYSVELIPNQWNEVYLDNIDESIWSDNEIFGEAITNENLNGLYFETLIDSKGTDNATLYFSNIYKIPLYSADRFNRIIEDAEITDVNVSHYKALTRAYYKFSELEKKQIVGFDEKVEKKLWQYYENRYDSTYTANKLVDFNSDMWREQIVVTGADVRYEQNEASAPNAREGETGISILNPTKDAYGITLTMTMPTTSQYASLERGEDKNYLYNGYSFWLYCPELNGIDVYASIAGVYMRLEQGAWNELKGKHGDMPLRGQEIQIYTQKNTAWDTLFPAGTQFKISSVYGQLKPTALMMQEYLTKLAAMPDGELVDSVLAQTAFEAWRMMNSYDLRNAVSGYNDFVDRYADLLIPENERVAGLAYAFNSEKGLKQVSIDDGYGFVSFTTEKKFGANNGSLLVVPDERIDPWSVYLRLNVPTERYSGAGYFYVWVEGSASEYQVSLDNPVDNASYGRSRTTLKKGEWTKVYVPATTAGFVGANIHFATNDWICRIPDDTKFYVSPIYFENFVESGDFPLDENELPFGKI